jgi:hypothetical protein
MKTLTATRINFYIIIQHFAGTKLMKILCLHIIKTDSINFFSMGRREL